MEQQLQQFSLKQWSRKVFVTLLPAHSQWTSSRESKQLLRQSQLVFARTQLSLRTRRRSQMLRRFQHRIALSETSSQKRWIRSVKMASSLLKKHQQQLSSSNLPKVCSSIRATSLHTSLLTKIAWKQSLKMLTSFSSATRFQLSLSYFHFLRRFLKLESHFLSSLKILKAKRFQLSL